MKGIRKWMLCALVAVIGCGFALSGCTTSGYDDTKTQLFVANYDGGVGSEWLEELKPRFEEAYKDVSFETGKTGVELIVDPSRNYQGTGNLRTMKTSYNHIFFSEAIYLPELINAGLLYDISDIVKENTAGGSIESRMKEQERDAIAAYGNGSYYALPHYEMYNGIIYDIDLFEEKGFYFSANPLPGSKGFIMDKDEQRTLGPDGKTGVDAVTGIDYSLDDGLPATTDELLALMNYIAVDNSMLPIIWSGESKQYSNMLLEKLSLNYDGDDASKVFYDFNYGKTSPVKNKIITSFNGTEPVIEEIEINERNGYLLRQSASKYYALDFMQQMYAKDRYYPSTATSGTGSHEVVHEKFIYSSIDPTQTPIAMMIEGTFWYRESTDILQRSVSEFPATSPDRNFGLMPLPLGDGVDKQVLGNTYYSYCMVNGNIKGNEAAEKVVKAFLQFAYGDSELRKFTVSTGTARQFDYELSEQEFNGMNKFYQNVWTARKNGEVVTSASTNDMFYNNISKLSQSYYNAWDATVNDQSYKVPITAFDNGVTARQYFDSFRITQDSWNAAYEDFFHE